MFKHLPALEVVISLLGAILTGISLQKKMAFRIALIIAVISSIISIYLFCYNDSLFYLFGSWQKNIGIEYKLDNLNKILLLFINLILLFFLTFNHKIIEDLVLSNLQIKWQYLFFTLILFVHAGYLGVVSTNDIFNLYVFIEISSLSSYILISLGDNLKAPIGALYYLIFGSIGTTLILISIGFLLAISGNLNFDVMNEIIKHQLNVNPAYYSIFYTAVIFFVVGALLKIACFPVYFWRKQAYLYASPGILIYLASISSTMGIYILTKFIYSITDYYLLIEKIIPVLLPLVCISILACSLLILFLNNLSDLIFYGILLNVSYAILFLLIKNGEYLVFPMLIIDGCIKLGLFFIQAHLTNKNNSLNNNYIIKILISIIIVSSAGLPLTPMFLVKFDMLKTLFENGYPITFFIIAISFIVTIFYHYKMLNIIFIQLAKNSIDIWDENKNYGLIFTIIIQIFLLVFFDKLLIKSNFL